MEPEPTESRAPLVFAPETVPAFVPSQGVCLVSPRIARQACQEFDTYTSLLAHITYLLANLIMASHAERQGTPEP